VVAKDGEKVLVREREKYPFKGYWEFCASKIKQDESFEEAATDRLKKKIGLEGSVSYKGIEFLQTKEKGKLIMHHHLHIFLAEKLSGVPKGGEWVDIKGFSPKNPLPHIEQTLKIALNEGFSLASSDLIKEGDKFIGYETHSFREFTRKLIG